MLLRSVILAFSVFATAEVATREASVNVVMRVFMAVPFVNDVSLS